MDCGAAANVVMTLNFRDSLFFFFFFLFICSAHIHLHNPFSIQKLLKRSFVGDCFLMKRGLGDKSIVLISCSSRSKRCSEEVPFYTYSQFGKKEKRKKIENFKIACASGHA